MSGLDGRSIVVAVDQSKCADKIFAWTLENFYKNGDTIHLVHVIPPGQTLVVTPGGFGDMGLDGVIEDDPETKRKVEEAAQNFIHSHFEEKLHAAKIPYSTHVLRAPMDNDSIGVVLCRMSEQLNAAALIMAKHSKGAIKEFLMGSVSNYCMHRCKQPVLVMHAD